MKSKLLTKINEGHDKRLKKFLYLGWEYRLRRKFNKIKIKPLTSEQKNEYKEYWKKFGKNVSPKWAEYFSSFNGKFDKEIIPESLYYTEIQPALNDFSKTGLNDKHIINRIFSAKMPETLLRRINGEYFDQDFNRTTLETGLENILNNKEAFIKPSWQTSFGAGTYLWREEKGKQELLDYINNSKADLIFQKPVKQHEDMAIFHPSSLNTLRIVSLRIKGEVVILNTILRMGTNNGVIDNFSAGGVIANVDKEGNLFASNAQSTGKVLTEHPTTKVVFAGRTIPNFDQVIKSVKRQHNYIPFYRMVAWDFAVAEDGTPILIEGNFPSGQLDLHQLNIGGLFGEYTDQVLSEIYLNK